MMLRRSSGGQLLFSAALLELAAFCAALTALFASCGNGSSGSDASIVADASGPPADASINVDGIPPLLWVDFAITGCESGGTDVDMDAGVIAPCTGTAPLSLGFTTVSPTPIDIYQWSFGDSGESEIPAPTHVYAMPGTYDVSLVVGGPGGTANVTKTGVVVVETAGLGARCTHDDQCDEDLDCICDGTATCPAELSLGICSQSCDETICSEGVCANLAPTNPTEPADWQSSLCLVSCIDDGDCDGNLVCRELLAGDGSGWVRACFAADLLGAIGQSCADADGDVDGSLCASGLCWGEGARGMCSQEECTDGSCPDSSACATFVDPGMGSHCLARCTAAGDCADDPWLACETPGGIDDKSFTVDEAPAPEGYCAPKSCTDGVECGDDGDCIDGFCGPM